MLSTSDLSKRLTGCHWFRIPKDLYPRIHDPDFQYSILLSHYRRNQLQKQDVIAKIPQSLIFSFMRLFSPTLAYPEFIQKTVLAGPVENYFPTLP